MALGWALASTTGCNEAGASRPAAALHQYAVTDAPAPQAEQVFHRRLTMEPRTIDPTLATGIPGFNVIQDLFEGLVTLSADGHLMPGDAESWEISDDGKTYVFHLRAGLRWSNGEPLKASDYVYAWRREVDPKVGAQYAESLEPIVNAREIVNGKKPLESLGVTAVDDRTLRVELEQPTPYFLAMLYNDYCMPLYAPAVEKWGDAWTRPEHIVSNGAFKLTEWVINGHLTLLKNPDFWDAAHVRLQQEIDYPLNDKAQSVSRFLAGDFDFLDNPAFSGSDTDWLRRQIGDQVQVTPYYATAYLGMLVHEKPFDNRDLRLALTMTLDRDVLSNKLSDGLSLPAHSLFPPLPGYTQQEPEWASWSMERRIAEARRLYHAAGYSAAHPLKVELVYMTEGVEVRNYMEAVVTMWNRALGSRITLHAEEWKVMLQDLQYKNAKLYWSAWVGDYPEPYTFAQQFKAGFGMNYGNYDNPDYQAAVARAVAATDEATRFAAYQQAEDILNQDAPFIPLYFYKSPELIKPYVAGVQSNVVALHLARWIWIRQHSEHGA